MLSSQAAVDKLLSTGVVSRVDLDETEGKKRWVQSREKSLSRFQTSMKLTVTGTRKTKTLRRPMAISDNSDV